MKSKIALDLSSQKIHNARIKKRKKWDKLLDPDYEEQEESEIEGTAGSIMF